MTTMKNQKGIAMVLALVMLMLLTMLGTFALNTSSTELFIAGNFRNMQQALYAADAGFEYALRGDTIYTDPKLAKDPNNANTGSWPLPTKGNGKDYNYNNVNIGGTTADVRVKYVKKAPNLPGGLVGYKPSDQSSYSAVYYLITSNGSGQSSASVSVEALTFRIVPAS